jgi:hypothetical protein
MPTCFKKTVTKLGVVVHACNSIIQQEKEKC